MLRPESTARQYRGDARASAESGRSVGGGGSSSRGARRGWLLIGWSLGFRSRRHPARSLLPRLASPRPDCPETALHHVGLARRCSISRGQHEARAASPPACALHEQHGPRGAHALRFDASFGGPRQKEGRGRPSHARWLARSVCDDSWSPRSVWAAASVRLPAMPSRRRLDRYQGSFAPTRPGVGPHACESGGWHPWPRGSLATAFATSRLRCLSAVEDTGDDAVGVSCEEGVFCMETRVFPPAGDGYGAVAASSLRRSLPNAGPEGQGL